MNRNIGMILAKVTMVFIAAASLTPRRISECTIHRSADETTMAVIVLPSPNTGKKSPSVDFISTK